MKDRNIPHSDNWQTPEWIMEMLTPEFKFDFDPCPINHDLSKFDGLKIEWGKTTFVNPPYNRKLKEAFIRKAFEESKKQKTIVMLLPVSTSTKIFHEIIYPHAEIRFIKGRVNFRGTNTKGEFVTDKKPMHDSMFVIFRSKTQ